MFLGLEHEHCGPFTQHEAVAILIEGARRRQRVVVARAQRLHGVEAGDGGVADDGFSAAGQRHVAGAAAQRTQARSDGMIR